MANLGKEVTSKIFGVFAGTFGVVSSLFVIIFIGLYFCFTPYSYLSGIFTLAPVAWHERIYQIIFANIYGFLGLLLATPLTAGAMVLVKMLYVEDVLGKNTDVHSSGSKKTEIKE